uniref:Histidine biosynthesis trifunctional protein n=1 Tax=Bartheletia paradoxa TaxID=669517 RepID=A0A2D0XI19_9BASI|nr:hypothetical protein SPAR01163 [Bartheletia paradoxa]
MASPIFLPLLDPSSPSSLTVALARVGPILVPAADLASTLASRSTASPYIVLAQGGEAIEDIIKWLDQGAEKVVGGQALVGQIPAERLILLVEGDDAQEVTQKYKKDVSGIFLRTPTIDEELVASFRKLLSANSSIHCDLFILNTASSVAPTALLVNLLVKASTSLVIPTTQLTLDASSATALNVADALLAPVTSDRPDGLFATIVASYSAGGRSLGLVYSSRESVSESIRTGKGVYQSRKHGLWRKGETSGSTQDIVSIRADCDSDCLEFQVIQHGSGFCHLGTQTCFGGLSGLSALEQTLISRKESAPAGSYTQRLFNDEKLLSSKIMEEADELCTADSKENVAFEAADLFYFALTRCVAAGVTLADIEANLDKKSKKITRRPGNAKAQWIKPEGTAPAEAPKATPAVSPVAAVQDDAELIKMTTHDLTSVSAVVRSELLKRPLIKSDEMMARVKPIVDLVRKQGDAGIIELTSKFDKVNMTGSPVILPPFSPESMVLPLDVKEAIDQAYANIRVFHAAQAEKAPLVVETMPGVVCSRFARPIARVGLYVPGGTAVLPSTALMLGVPAQVAGCGQIVIATPPRPDGSIVPEVMYVAHLVGASCILKAGGAQAVAAMAYGTETVPKVDKIFGPGNQYVTAAKMMVQNDTEALVGIDMPAGPSEVLVIADSTANPAFVAADLLSQAEHGVDSQVVLLAIDLTPTLLASIEEQIDTQARALPRVDIVRQAIRKSIVIKVADLSQAMEFSNDYAPEHLILHLADAPGAVKLVENAGSVFVGAWSPESCGDYASGTNHTLPTYGFARQYSGVNTLSFQKHITSQQITPQGLDKLGPVVVTLAEREGLQGHANAVKVRLQARE